MSNLPPILIEQTPLLVPGNESKEVEVVSKDLMNRFTELGKEFISYEKHRKGSGFCSLLSVVEVGAGTYFMAATPLLSPFFIAGMVISCVFSSTLGIAMACGVDTNQRYNDINLKISDLFLPNGEIRQLRDEEGKSLIGYAAEKADEFDSKTCEWIEYLIKQKVPFQYKKNTNTSPFSLALGKNFILRTLFENCSLEEKEYAIRLMAHRFKRVNNVTKSKFLHADLANFVPKLDVIGKLQHRMLLLSHAFELTGSIDDTPLEGFNPIHNTEKFLKYLPSFYSLFFGNKKTTSFQKILEILDAFIHKKKTNFVKNGILFNIGGKGHAAFLYISGDIKNFVLVDTGRYTILNNFQFENCFSIFGTIKPKSLDQAFFDRVNNLEHLDQDDNEKEITKIIQDYQLHENVSKIISAPQIGGHCMYKGLVTVLSGINTLIEYGTDSTEVQQFFEYLFMQDLFRIYLLNQSKLFENEDFKRDSTYLEFVQSIHKKITIHHEAYQNYYNSIHDYLPEQFSKEEAEKFYECYLTEFNNANAILVETISSMENAIEVVE